MLRTNTALSLSAFSIGSDFKKTGFGERLQVEESLFYRSRYGNDNKEKTIYNIFSIYKRESLAGICPYGMDIDLMSEKFEKSKGNTFRYWNKARLGFKMLLEYNFKYPEKSAMNFINGEVYFSFLHLPRPARGDLTTKARKGSFMFYVLATPTMRAIVYMKYNVGSVWIKPYYRQEKRDFELLENSVGLHAEVEVNRNGYNRSIVESSRDIYRGWTIIGGPEYNMTLSRIFFNVGISLTTENH